MAPISSSVVIRPVRRGFIMTPSMITSEPGVIRPRPAGSRRRTGSVGTTIVGAARACRLALEG